MATAKKVDFRRLKEERESLKKKAKIDSPLARYNGSGQLFCVLCNAPVKNELLWNAHVQSKKHKETLVELKSKKQEASPQPNSKTDNSQKSHTFAKPEMMKIGKRKTEEEVEVKENPQKKQRASVNNLPSSLPSDFFDNASKRRSNSENHTSDESDNGDDNDNDEHLTSPHSIKQNQTPTSRLPADFFDKNGEKNTTEASKARKASEELPEGFFDDPKLDAKARHVEYKDPVEQEWEKFQKEIQMENQVSEALVEEDDEVARIDRQLHELNEQSQYFLRAHDLRDKQTIIKQHIATAATEERKQDNGASSDGDDYEDFFDWRAKKAL